ncbi:MAG: GNAT family N-acetyltransferase [Clostridia bacterium]|nr:GNAT family N-acetyltransferase [Clostridia bacterium]
MSENVRKATKDDVCRMAEIIVFNNRKNYYPIFGNIEYSFGDYNVFSVADEFLKDDSFMNNCYVYEDKVIKGFICVIDREITKLYVDTFFQKSGIGHKLIEFAIENFDADNLWALEKNTNAIAFYESHGFKPTGEKILEEDTPEYLIKMIRE